MAEDPEKRKARHRRYMERLAADPAAREDFLARSKAATQRYSAKKKLERDSSGPVKKGKPGRIVALSGWMKW